MRFATIFSINGKMMWSGDKPDVIMDRAKDFEQEEKNTLKDFLVFSKPGYHLCIGDLAIVRQPD